MAMVEPFFHAFGINIINLNKSERIILEAELLIRIYVELREYLNVKHRYFYTTLKISSEEADVMLDGKFVNLLIEDILASGEYDINGIALYTNTPDDVFADLFISANPSPSAILQRKVIELHRLVRKDLYKHIIKKTVIDLVKNYHQEFEIT